MSEQEYRSFLIKELAKVQVGNPNYSVSQWELDVLKLGINACHSVSRMGDLANENDELTRQNKILRDALEYVLEDHDCEHIDCIEFNKQRAREALKSCGGGVE